MIEQRLRNIGLMQAGLNPYEGILHVAYRNRPALSFDLMEEFRQPIVDRVVITQMTQKQVHEEEFERREDMCYMSEGVRRRFLDALYHRFEDIYTFQDERIEFLDIIFEQAKLLARAIYYGLRRVQYSVFNGIVTLKDKEALLKEINDLELGEEDKIHVIDLCEACRREVIIIGKMPQVREHIVV